jgi:hypothetical protein
VDHRRLAAGAVSYSAFFFAIGPLSGLFYNARQDSTSVGHSLEGKMRTLGWFPSIVLTVLLTAPVGAQQTPQPNGGPFVEQRTPRFVPAAQADFMIEGERVVGVNQNGIAKAYAVRFMAFHHIIQDRLKEMPILATW